MSEASFDRILSAADSKVRAAIAGKNGQAALDAILELYAAAARESAQVAWTDAQGHESCDEIMQLVEDGLIAEFKANNPLMKACKPPFADMAERAMRNAYDDEHLKLDAGYDTPRGRA